MTNKEKNSVLEIEYFNSEGEMEPGDMWRAIDELCDLIRKYHNLRDPLTDNEWENSDWEYHE